MSLMGSRHDGQQLPAILAYERFLCAFCAKSANKECSRCGEFYCSLECQLADWRNHRFICIPLPQLLPLKISRDEYIFRKRSSRAPSSSNGPDRNVAAKLNANVANGLVEPKIVDSEHDVIIVDESVRSDAQKCDEKIVPVVERTCSGANQLIDAVENISLQMSSIVEDHNSVIGPEEESRISQIKIEPTQTPPPIPQAILLAADTAVMIVNVKDHKTVHVRRKTMRGESDQYRKLIQMAIDAAIHAECLQSQLHIGDMVLATSNTQSIYGRASIEQIIGFKALVYFLEFGCLELVDVSIMKILPDALRHYPCLLNEVVLTGVPASVDNPEKIIEYLMKLCYDQTLLTLTYGDGNVKKSMPSRICIDAELIEVLTSASINQNVMASIKGVSIDSDDASANVSLENVPSNENTMELSHKGFSGENVNILILDNSLLQSGYISCIQVSDSKLFSKNDECVNEFGAKVANGEPFLPSAPGMLCIVRSAEDHRWYRAMFMERNVQNMYEFVYIDYGNMETVNASQIREIDEKLNFTCITVSCYIDGVTWMKRKLPKRLVDRLQVMLPSYEKVEFDEIVYFDEEKTAIGKKHQIAKILKDEQLI